MRRKGRQIDLGDALGSLERRLDRKSGGAYSQVRVANAWEKVAGSSVASHTTGAHLREGELVIHVDSQAWATELSALAGPYRQAIQVEMGEIPVTSIRFTVSRRVQARQALIRAEAETDEFYRPDETKPVPLTEHERQQVEESASVIQDEELREVVVRATIADLEWKKGCGAVKERDSAPEGV